MRASAGPLAGTYDVAMMQEFGWHRHVRRVGDTLALAMQIGIIF